MRTHYVDVWKKVVNVNNFSMRQFMSTESDQLIWKGQGLPSDSLSVQNAIVIKQVTRIHTHTHTHIHKHEKIVFFIDD